MVGGQSSAGNDTVDVWMALQGLAPGVENAQESDLGAEVPPVGGDFGQGCGAGVEQQLKKQLLVLPDQGSQSVGKTKYKVIVVSGEQFPLPRSQPFLACVGLTFWAMAVSAGVIGDGLVAAVSALIAMSAESGRTAAFNGEQHF